MTIIGITGTLGAGKGTVVEYLIKKGFKHYSAREYLRSLAKERGLPLVRESYHNIANELRRQSPSRLMDALYEQAETAGGNAVIESIHTPGELRSLKGRGAIMFAVDADIKKRYDRILGRGSETDKRTYEEFMADQEAELVNQDENMQNLSKCIELADYVLLNNGTREDLWSQVDRALGDLQIT